MGSTRGSQGGANSAAALTLFVTHISASAGALTWMFIEWYTIKKPSVLGIATGSIAGLAAITPASGVSGPLGALMIGTVSGALCWYVSVKVKNRFKYDDSLDVVGVHGVGGLVGTILAALVGIEALGGVGGFTFGEQIVKQLIGAGVTTVYTLVATIALLYLTRAICGGLRVSEREENRRSRPDRPRRNRLQLKQRAPRSPFPQVSGAQRAGGVPNQESMVIGDLDLSLIDESRMRGTVLPLRDSQRKSDVFEMTESVTL